MEMWDNIYDPFRKGKYKGAPTAWLQFLKETYVHRQWVENEQNGKQLYSSSGITDAFALKIT